MFAGEYQVRLTSSGRFETIATDFVGSRHFLSPHGTHAEDGRPNGSLVPDCHALGWCLGGEADPMTKMIGVLLATLLLPAVAAAQTLYVDEQFGFDLTSGVVFASKPAGSPVASMDLRLELYQPTGLNVPVPRPAIILIHGGGFVVGSRFNARLIEICERMARRGYACVSIDYRLEGDDPVVGAPFTPLENFIVAGGATAETAAASAAAAEDSWAAYEWMVANAASLGVDVDRIGVGGSSAGAYTSLSLGYVLDEIGPAPPNTFRAVFDMWGGLGTGVSLLDGSDAPLLITHGSADFVVPASEAYALEAQAIAVGMIHEIHVVSGAGHGYDIFTTIVAPGETMFDRFVGFFNTHVATPDDPTAVPMLSAGFRLLMLATFVVAGRIVLTRTRRIDSISSRGSSR
jgi:para-nitrobenzyl esterase